MNSLQTKNSFRDVVKVVPGGPPVGTPGQNRAEGLLTALDTTVDFADERLPAPLTNGVRTVTVNFTLDVVATLASGRGFSGPNTGAGDRNFLQGNWELRAYGADADYKAFVDTNGYAIVRKDYLDDYVNQALSAARIITDVPLAKRNDVVGANAPAVVETDPAYYQKYFIDEVTTPGVIRRYDCLISAQADGSIVWKWFRSTIS